MATHSSVLAWRIPGTGEPGGPLSMGSHRVGHNWSDLAAAAAWNRWTLLQVRFLPFSLPALDPNALSRCPQGTCCNPVCIPAQCWHRASQQRHFYCFSFIHSYILLRQNYHLFFQKYSVLQHLGFRVSCCVCAQLHSTLWDLMNCSPPGFSVHGISQAPILKWVAISSSGDLPDPGLKPMSPALAGGFLTTELPGKPQSFLSLWESYWGRHDQIPETVWQDEAESLEMV